MAHDRDTYKYHLKSGKKVVHYGITYDLGRREAQHQKRFPGSHIIQIGQPTTRESAMVWEHKEGQRFNKTKKSAVGNSQLSKR